MKYRKHVLNDRYLKNKNNNKLTTQYNIKTFFRTL